jgi:hypothetical protein
MDVKTDSLRISRPYTAVIGDMIASRTLPSDDRKRVQERFTRFIDALNQDERYGAALVSKFAITLGDEFQCILNDASVLPDLIWDVANAADLPIFRLGIGYGRIDTEIPAYAINLDGPALHNARAAINTAKSEKALGGVFVGFGDETDRVANGIARLLWFHLHKCTPAQCVVLGFLRRGHSQTEIAKLTDRKIQAINSSKDAAGWDAFHAGEQALCAILRLSDMRDRAKQELELPETSFVFGLAG